MVQYTKLSVFKMIAKAEEINFPTFCVSLLKNWLVKKIFILIFHRSATNYILYTLLSNITPVKYNNFTLD